MILKLVQNLDLIFDTFKRITNNMDLYLAGAHCLIKQPEPYTDLPFNFYRDMGINVSYFRSYFYINPLSESKKLFEKVKNIKQYIFVHNLSSSGKAFDLNEMEQKLGFNKNHTLVINPCINMYNMNE